MTLTQILVVLRARWLSALLVLLVVVGAVVATTLLLPKRYTATAAVVLDVKSPDPIAGMVLPGMTVSGYMATQVDVLRSERVALRALEALRLFDRTTLQDAWQRATDGRGDFRAWLSDAILADLEVRPARDSNVISVGYTAADPAFAAEVANAFVQAYTDTTLELRVEPARRYNDFFDDRARELRNALEKAQARLSSYHREKGILVNDERLDVENSRLSELSTQLVTLQALADESASRQHQAGANATQMPEVLANPLVSGLTGDLSRQEYKLSELQQRLGDRHPEVVQLQASIENLRARIRAETRRVASSLTVNNTVNQARIAEVRNALEQQRAKVLRLKGERDEAGVLQRDVENAQKAYDAVVARVSQTSTESQANQTNVALLKKASVPARASWPRMRLNVLAGLALGLLLALGVTIVRELRDQRLRTLDDVTNLLQLPALGILPERSRAGLLSRSNARLTKRRLLEALPRPRPQAG
jgi:succinoglycan biosynthesis transport protein ExoP